MLIDFYYYVIKKATLSPSHTAAVATISKALVEQGTESVNKRKLFLNYFLAPSQFVRKGYLGYHQKQALPISASHPVIQANLHAAREDRVVGTKCGARMSVNSAVGLAVERLVDLVTKSRVSVGHAVGGLTSVGQSLLLGSRVAELVGDGGSVSNVLRSSNTTFGDRVILLDHLGSTGDIFRGGC